MLTRSMSAVPRAARPTYCWTARPPMRRRRLPQRVLSQISAANRSKCSTRTRYAVLPRCGKAMEGRRSEQTLFFQLVVERAAADAEDARSHRAVAARLTEGGLERLALGRATMRVEPQRAVAGRRGGRRARASELARH